MRKDGLGVISGIEGALRKELFKTCRGLIEAILNDTHVPVPHDHPHEHERPAGRHSRQVFCEFGRIWMKDRAYYHNANTREGRFPADEALALQHGATPAFAQRAMNHVATQSYDKAARHLRDDGLEEVTPDLLKALCKKLGPTARRHAREAPPAPPRPAVPCVVIGVDGAAVPMRPEEVRGVKGRGPGGTAKTREAKIGIRHEALLTPGQEPRRVDGSVRLTATLGKKDVFGELLRADYLRDYTTPPGLVLFLGDGAPWIWNLRRAQFPFAVEILDFYHAMVHLDPLLDLWGLADKERAGMRGKWKDWLLAGKVGDLIAACEARAFGSDSARSESWRKALLYYRKNRGRMRYDEYRAKGWPIGSGPVEGACKTVVVERFQCAGMRWSRKGASNVLPFRTAFLTDQSDDLWRFIVGERKILAAA
jgi:hypothetical protein